MVRAMVPRRLRVRRHRRGGGRARRACDRRTRHAGRADVRRRLLEPDPLHHADGDDRDHRLRGGSIETGVGAHRAVRARAAFGPRRHHVRGADQYCAVVVQLGDQPRIQRPSGARARPARRLAHGLSGGGRGRVSGHGRDVGARAEFGRRAASGESGEFAQIDQRHHGRAAVLANHLPTAIDGDGGRAWRGIAGDRVVFIAERCARGKRVGPGRRPLREDPDEDARATSRRLARPSSWSRLGWAGWGTSLHRKIRSLPFPT
jgi:hypothetical protein